MLVEESECVFREFSKRHGHTTLYQNLPLNTSIRYQNSEHVIDQTILDKPRLAPKVVNSVRSAENAHRVGYIKLTVFTSRMLYLQMHQN